MLHPHLVNEVIMRATLGVFLLTLGCSDKASETTDVEDSGDTVEDTGAPEVGCTAEDDRFEALSAAIEAERQALGATAMSVAVVVDGELVWCGGFGQRHPGDGGTVDGQTYFRMGSVNKMMTATALLQQVEAGAVALDELVIDTLPDFTMAADPRYLDITGQDLLTHQGAFYDYLEIDSDHADEALAGAVEGWFDEGMVLLAPPGQFWNYSNPNWYVAGRMIEVLDGRSYVSYMDEAVFAPLGMDRTGFDADEMLADGNYATSVTLNWTDEGGTRLAGPDSYDNAWARPAGYAWTSAEDLARFGQFLLDGDSAVLSDALRAEMMAPQVSLDIIDSQSYGYGLFVDEGFTVSSGDWVPDTLLSHGGDISGFAADLYLLPEHDFAIAILAAGDGAHLSTAVMQAVETFVTLSEPVEAPDLTIDPKTFTDFAGSYTEPWNITGDFSLSVEDGVLVSDFPVLDKHKIPYERELVAVAPDNFRYVVQGYPFLMTFIRDDAGEVAYARTRLFVGTATEDQSAQQRRAFSPDRLEAALRSAGPSPRSGLRR